MKLRESEYIDSDVQARWLDAEHAKNAYDFALRFSDKGCYGLCSVTVDDIEHLDIASYSVADAWLKDRLPVEGTVQIVYGDDEVCVLSAEAFVANWKEIFVPARDDAVILHNLSAAVLFYCHEEELEFGYRKA